MQETARKATTALLVPGTQRPRGRWRLFQTKAPIRSQRGTPQVDIHICKRHEERRKGGNEKREKETGKGVTRKVNMKPSCAMFFVPLLLFACYLTIPRCDTYCLSVAFHYSLSPLLSSFSFSLSFICFSSGLDFPSC